MNFSVKISRNQKFLNILEKVRVLDEFKKPENGKMTLRKKAAFASELLGRHIGKSTIEDWMKKEAEYRRQAAGVHDGSSNKKPKRLRASSTFDYGEDLSKVLMEYASHSNITNEIMLAEARKIQQKKYPDLQKLGRKGKDLIELDFVRDIMNEKGWLTRNVLGKKKLVLPGVIEKDYKEIAVALEGFSDH